MESLSKQELIGTITKQADQIKRYETRLRDVVAAYKGLAKQKDALEISLKALNRTEGPSEGGDSSDTKDDSVAALTLSLSTLTEEKTRMEEAFQADKKLTREKDKSVSHVSIRLKMCQQICGDAIKAPRFRDSHENQLTALKEETRMLIQQHLAEANNLKAKIAYEIQEREKERADHSAMMKELHMKLNSERKTKEKLEDRVVTNTEAQVSQAELEKRVRDLSSSLEAAQRRLKRAEERTVETPALLVRLQQKLALVEQSHSVAIREEQIKAKRAEEAARKQIARQEDRVALLEGKLAELSHTVGEYDLRRRRDQLLIQQLQDSLNGKLLAKVGNGSEQEELPQKSETDNEKLADSEYLQTLIDKIHILKKELIAENAKLGNPIDTTTVFKIEGYENLHTKCIEKYEALKLEFDVYKNQNASPKDDNSDLLCEIAELKSEVTVLKEKLETYVMVLDEEKQDKADSLKLYEEKLKSEQDYHKELTSDLKTRIHSLEKQVQTQRDRYALLLEETDNLIRSRSERSRRASTAHAHWNDDLTLNDVTAPPHMLHYAHEVARKDLDISQLRKEKHVLEGQFRDCQREATIEKERFKEVVRTLKEEIDRLRRIQSREGANLEYLKNVVLAYLVSADSAGRKHMLNAIAAVLHFSDAERNMLFDGAYKKVLLTNMHFRRYFL